jgi:mannose-6-phosphate isomerase-like protein (cupin superfamily)
MVRPTSKVSTNGNRSALGANNHRLHHLARGPLELAVVTKIREGASDPINLNIVPIDGVTSSAVKRLRRHVDNATTILNPFKHAPAIEISTWYKGILSTQLATDENTGGAFDLVLAHMKSGTEPPPHVHTREHELFYVLEGALDAYVDGEVFQVGPGECVFLPLGRPHAFIIRSPEIRMLTLITPGGFMRVVALMTAPAEKLEIPLDSVTYATADLAETMKIFMKHGLRFLSPEEITRQMPMFPLRSAA